MSKAPSLCSVRGCRKPAAQRGQCYAHIKQDYAKRHPLRYCYNSLKQNAKRRGKAFELTFEQFEEFATRTDYINKRGTGAHGFTIDRIDPTKGYTAENIQVLTNAQNVRKYARIDSHWDGQQMQFTTIIEQATPEPADHYPF
jgi:hypothetical protein